MKKNNFFFIAIAALTALLITYAVNNFPELDLSKAQETKRVLVLNYDPIIESKNNQRLSRLNGWNETGSLVSQFVQDINDASGGFVNYQIVETIDIDAIPTKQDGFEYTDETYLDCWSNHSTCHSPDIADYNKILTDYGVCERRNSDNINEVWLFGGPWFGYYESRLAGPEAFWYNSPALKNTTCNKQLPIMGFNYERQVPQMLHSYGHRVESVMRETYGGWTTDPTTPWNRFTLYDKVAPGQAACGNVHYPPNATQDYDSGNKTVVTSSCEDWLNYPNLTGVTQEIDCSPWQCGDAWEKWWLSHLPKAPGITEGKLNNWWKYVLDYEAALIEEKITPTPTGSTTPTPGSTSIPSLNEEPRITTRSLKSGRVERNYSANIKALDPDMTEGLVMTFTNLPPGILASSCETKTSKKGTEIICSIKGTPSARATYGVEVTVEDSANHLVSKTFDLKIR